MSPVGDSGRASGAGGRVDPAYAQKLLDKAQSGEKLSRAELATLRAALASPSLRDGFSAEQQGTLEGFIRGNSGPKDVEALLPNMSRIDRLEEISRRFGADFSAIRDQLVDARSFSSQDRATRAIEYFAAYAQRFVELTRTPVSNAPPRVAAADGSQLGSQRDGEEDEATVPEGRPRGEGRHSDSSVAKVTSRSAKEVPGTSAAEAALHGSAHQTGAQKLPNEKVKTAREAFLAVLREHGFDQIHETTKGKDGLRIAQEMLSAKSPQEVFRILEGRSFTGAGFPPGAGELGFNGERVNLPHDQLRDATEAAVIRAKAAQDGPRIHERDAAGLLRVPGSLADGHQPVSFESKHPSLGPLSLLETGLLKRRRFRLTDKKLGRNFLWNVLHRLRGDDETTAITEEQWEKITVAALLILLSVALLTVVLVNL